MIDVDLSHVSDEELAALARVHLRDLAYPLSAANVYPNAIFAEQQRRHGVRVRRDETRES